MMERSMMRHFSCWLLVAATAVGSACSRGSAKTTRLVVDTIGSVVHFRYSAATYLETLAPAVTIGDEGPAGADSGFAHVSSIALEEDGSVLVADGQKLTINLYNPSGQLVTSFGRSGQGPGEFHALYSLAFLGDTLLTLDGPNARVSLFSSTGKFLSTWPWMRLTGPPTAVRFFEMGPGEVHVLAVRHGPGPSGPTYIRLMPTGPADTITFTHTFAKTNTTLVCPRPDQGISFFSTPFAQKAITVPTPNGLFATVSTDKYEIALMNQAGDTVKVISRDYEAVPIADDEWNAATAEFEEFRKAWPGVKCEPVAMSRPAYHTAVLGIYFDRDGTMIVEVTAANAVRYDLYAEDGTSAGTFILPPRDNEVLPYFRGNRIAQVVKDSLDVQSVQVFTRR
jgi:hypothetical protein